MIDRGNDVVVVGSVAGGVTAEEDLSSVELERVVKSVEVLRRNQVPRHEHVGSLEHLRHDHLLRLSIYLHSLIQVN